MIAVLTLVYASFYFVFFGKGIVRKSARNISIFVGVGVVMVGTIIVMWWTFSPTTTRRSGVPVCPTDRAQCGRSGDRGTRRATGSCEER